MFHNAIEGCIRRGKDGGELAKGAVWIFALDNRIASGNYTLVCIELEQVLWSGLRNGLTLLATVPSLLAWACTTLALAAVFSTISIYRSKFEEWLRIRDTQYGVVPDTGLPFSHCWTMHLSVETMSFSGLQGASRTHTMNTQIVPHVSRHSARNCFELGV